MEKMPEDKKKILKLRYENNLTIKEVSEKLGKSIQGMYKYMSQIHFLLQECTEGMLAAWGSGR